LVNFKQTWAIGATFDTAVTLVVRVTEPFSELCLRDSGARDSVNGNEIEWYSRNTGMQSSRAISQPLIQAEGGAGEDDCTLWLEEIMTESVGNDYNAMEPIYT
jgi:hypothetical protein